MTEPRSRATSIALWTLIALAWLVSLAGLLSIGLFTMPLTVAGAVVVGARPGRTRTVATLLTGAAVGPLLLAWFNREGPGRVCHTYAGEGPFCADLLSPWPFVLAGLAALVVAAALFARAARGGPPVPPVPGSAAGPTPSAG